MRYLDGKLDATLSSPLVQNGGMVSRADQDDSGDHVTRILADWARERPDVDVSPMAVVARISRVARYLEVSIDATLRAYNLNHSSFGVLAALRRAGAPYRLSPSELHNSLLISSGTMTNRLDRLEGAGYVTRQPDPTDRRGVLVRLTDRGLAVVDEALVAHVEGERKMLAPLTPRQQQELADLLSQLLSTFDHGISTQKLRDSLPAS
jgi:DNA-binding MarR family transcriptional regulator